MTNPSRRALLGAAAGAFETVEDDRADSHPAGQPHILTRMRGHQLL